MCGAVEVKWELPSSEATDVIQTKEEELTSAPAAADIDNDEKSSSPKVIFVSVFLVEW